MSGEFLLGYEAGTTDYGLCRVLKKLGYNCVIMAPTTIRKASGDKVKTDRKDARLLSMTLASDGYRKVYLPDPSDESTKEFTRTRNTLKGHLKKAKQNLLSFLLRVGMKGKGIAVLFEVMVRNDLEEGTLIKVPVAFSAKKEFYLTYRKDSWLSEEENYILTLCRKSAREWKDSSDNQTVWEE